jgi:hypothetical protein
MMTQTNFSMSWEGKMIKQKKNGLCIYFSVYALLSVMSAILALGCTRTVEEPTLGTVQQPQYPAEVKKEQLKPGLSVIYIPEKYRHVKEMPSMERMSKYAYPGPPILKIDHRFGYGKVFDSGRSEGVGMIMSGYLHLKDPGVYRFQANSNDGFRLYIGNDQVIDDPGVHPDKLSDPGEVEALKGGWYPVEIKYFQRKGTATLELYWQPPGAEAFTIIPEEVYAHIGS